MELINDTNDETIYILFNDYEGGIKVGQFDQDWPEWTPLKVYEGETQQELDQIEHRKGLELLVRMSEQNTMPQQSISDLARAAGIPVIDITPRRLPKNLGQYGFSPEQEQYDFGDLSEIRGFIATHFEKQDSINTKYSSYYLKHVAENKLKRYVPNGELIAGMILEGFTYQQISKRNPNALFNVTGYSVLKNF